MSARGFRNYRREWWHFRYAGEPFAGRVFDFDILPKTR
jgi:D-alanyl-D-alanine dipeptidase